MTNIFKEAHRLAKATTNKFGGNYRANFIIALKELYAVVKEAKEKAKYWLGIDPMGNVVRFINNILSAWEEQNKANEEKRQGIVEMKYSEYKNNYDGCKTVYGSYDKKTKTIKVYVPTSNGYDYGYGEVYQA